MSAFESVPGCRMKFVVLQETPAEPPRDALPVLGRESLRPE